jgi:ATP-dependent protease ClpP protease subunit
MSNTVARPPTEAEEDAHRADAEKNRAEARKLNAEAEQAEHASAVALILRTQAEEDERHRVESDAHRRVYRFAGAVTASSASDCIRKLTLWDRLDPECPVEIIFNSPGGSVIDGMALFDVITSMSLRGGGTHEVTVGTLGYAASMAGILLQAGDVRWMGKQSYLMIHEISAGTGGKIGEIKDDVKFYEAICARVVDIFVARSGGKITKAKFVRGWLRTDWWILSDEALKLGFVDEVR